MEEVVSFLEVTTCAPSPLEACCNECAPNTAVIPKGRAHQLIKLLNPNSKVYIFFLNEDYHSQSTAPSQK